MEHLLFMRRSKSHPFSGPTINSPTNNLSMVVTRRHQRTKMCNLPKAEN